MKPFQKDKLLLLEELREIVSTELSESHDFRHGNMDEKRKNRRLKLIRRELDKWICETVDYRKDTKRETGRSTPAA